MRRLKGKAVIMSLASFNTKGDVRDPVLSNACRDIVDLKGPEFVRVDVMAYSTLLSLMEGLEAAVLLLGIVGLVEEVTGGRGLVGIGGCVTRM